MNAKGNKAFGHALDESNSGSQAIRENNLRAEIKALNLSLNFVKKQGKKARTEFVEEKEKFRQLEIQARGTQSTLERAYKILEQDLMY